MTQLDELKPCAHCGDDEELRVQADTACACPCYWWAVCGACGARVPAESERGAISGWNARADDTLQAEITSLKRQVEGWQPIETAPKDGTGVLVICMGAECPMAGCGWFMHDVWTTLDPDGTEQCGADFFQSSMWQEPTHWRPLPDPPNESTTNEDRG